VSLQQFPTFRHKIVPPLNNDASGSFLQTPAILGATPSILSDATFHISYHPQQARPSNTRHRLVANPYLPTVHDYRRVLYKTTRLAICASSQRRHNGRRSLLHHKDVTTPGDLCFITKTSQRQAIFASSQRRHNARRSLLHHKDVTTPGVLCFITKTSQRQTVAKTLLPSVGRFVYITLMGHVFLLGVRPLPIESRQSPMRISVTCDLHTDNSLNLSASVQSSSSSSFSAFFLSFKMVLKS
jgi:hypothetical protein